MTAAARDQRDHRALIGIGHGGDEFLVMIAESQRGPIATGGEGERASGGDARRGLESGMACHFGRERFNQRGVVGTGKQVTQLSRGRLVPDVLALVVSGVANHHDRNVTRRGQRRRRREITPIVVDHVDLGQGGANCREGGHDIGSPHVARSTVTEIAQVGQGPDNGGSVDRGSGQREQRCSVHGGILEEDHGFGRGLVGQGAVFGAGQHADVGARALQEMVEPEQRGHDRNDAAVHVVGGHRPLVECGAQARGPHHAIGHLDVQPGNDRAAGISQSKDPVTDHEAAESPLVA